MDGSGRAVERRRTRFRQVLSADRSPVFSTYRTLARACSNKTLASSIPIRSRMSFSTSSFSCSSTSLAFMLKSDSIKHRASGPVAAASLPCESPCELPPLASTVPNTRSSLHLETPKRRGSEHTRQRHGLGREGGGHTQGKRWCRTGRRSPPASVPAGRSPPMRGPTVAAPWCQRARTGGGAPRNQRGGTQRHCGEPIQTNAGKWKCRLGQWDYRV